MAWKQGDIFICTDCSCELTLTKPPGAGQAANLTPTCCSCGESMAKK